jgi:hypothetical protein
MAAALTWLAGCGGGSSSQDAPRVEAAPDATSPDRSFVIPEGTGDRVAAGEDVELVPSPLVLSVGDVVQIRNDDSIGYDVGPFYVGPHETMTQRVASKGSYTSSCGLHPTGEITVTVQ